MSPATSAHWYRSNATLYVLVVILIAVAWVAIGIGYADGGTSLDVGWFRWLFHEDSAIEKQVLLSWRGPRVVAAIVVGAALGLAGLLLQGTLNNPLADPYLLGISGGAGLAMVLFQGYAPVAIAQLWWAAPFVSLLGAIAMLFVVIGLSRNAGMLYSTEGIILSGVVVNAFCAAVIGFVLARFDPMRLRITSTWLTGGISYIGWPQLMTALLIVIVVLFMTRAKAHAINALSAGPEVALSVGVDAQKLFRTTTLLACLLSALSVSMAGLLGYVGLIVPHAVRLWMGADYRRLLPMSAVAGSLLLLLADTTGRVIFSPEELPVGVLTSFVGCPVLLLLLRRSFRDRRG